MTIKKWRGRNFTVGQFRCRKKFRQYPIWMSWSHV